MALIILEYFTSLFWSESYRAGLRALQRLCQHKVKRLYSCSLHLMQAGKCKFASHIHTTWEELFSPALYFNWHSLRQIFFIRIWQFSFRTLQGDPAGFNAKMLLVGQHGKLKRAPETGGRSSPLANPLLSLHGVNFAPSPTSCCGVRRATARWRSSAPRRRRRPLSRPFVSRTS